MSEIIVENLSHVYSEGTPFEKTAIENVNVNISHGQLVGIIGHTGSGKSTFTQHLNGLLKPTSGTIKIDGQDIFESKQITHSTRFKVGLVFQYPEYQLFEETVYKDISFGPKNMKLSDDEIDARVREAAGFVGVGEEYFERSPLELSGGQKRRVAIAGVIAMRPSTLILDEPTAGLDPEGCRQILSNIISYKEKTGSTVLLVSHSMDDVARIADRLIVFNKGHVFMDGTPNEVFSHAEELTDIGLSVPESTQIAIALRKRGININEAIYTEQQLIDSIASLRRRDN